MNTRVLVTGATGFSGQHVCRELLSRGYEVIGTSVNQTDKSDASLHQLDICDSTAVNDLFREIQPTHLLHLAGIASPAEGDKLAFFDVNTLGAVNLLEACRSEATSFCKAVLISSANIYGQPGLEVLHEDLCPAPVNAYGCSKLAMEHLAANFKKDYKLQIVRPFNFTGRGQTTKFLVPKIVEHFRLRRDEIELGNIQVSRDFSDVRDVACELSDLLFHETATETVNMCCGDFLRLQDILDLCTDITGHTLSYRVNPDFVRVNEIMKLRGSRARLDAIIGPRPPRPFAETLRWMLNAD